MATRTTLPLAALRAFDAAARLRSVSAAARELGVTQPAVSEQLRALEARVGAALFERTPRGLVPTPRGAALEAEVAPAFGALRRAVGGADAGDGAVRLCLFPSLAFRWLVPRLPRLRRDLPGLRLSVATAPSWSPALLRGGGGGGHDVAARLGAGGWAGLRAARVAEDRLLPVTAPGPARERAGRPRIACAGRPDAWALWGEGAPSAAGPRPALAVDTNLLATAMAEAGAGTAVAPEAFVRDALAAGRLVAAGPPADPSGRGYFLVAPPSAPAPVRRFLEWAADAGADGP